MTHARWLGMLIALTLVVGHAGAQQNPLAPEGPSGFVERFEGTDPAGPLNGILTIGADGPWTGVLTGSTYQLRNGTDGGAVRFHYLSDAPGATGPLTQGTVSVEVAVQTDPNDDVAGAGLVFDFQDASRDYFAFVVTARGYALYRRDAEGLRSLVAEASDAVRTDGFNRLIARSAAGQIDLFVNDTFVLGLQSDGALDGGIGIVAIGIGTFTYDTFAYQGH